ncbi:HORMA-domain-containing protein [Polyporus arcularius HHB13444]|uniref:HORMA-domain-containing protein n=1 Tax=Polyporus arcularius HHB13444 TaxID=1314778 RepID=A0A5C3PY65_9APHY|nr:HORMA-domain-containing protein [Polyporus arcularius HHB13444]
MQAQALKTEQHQAVITSQQSLQSIQTLLRAGLGCITYLRNLLPSDNFSESYLTSAGPESLSSQPSRTDSSFGSSDARKNVSGFKIMSVTRGFTEEADKLLDYLDNGIFDALSKQYLRSFIFAIYLDDQDPNNIIEAYTFNFSYCQVPGTTEVVPVMTLGDEMSNLSLSGSGSRKAHDPVAEATKRGKVPTLGDVKRSLKTLIKNLIQATTQMDALPKRRFATFKLFYYDNTPDDYEPPHFRAGDTNKDKWFMTTHHKGEMPERCSVGFVHTGYHGVDVKVTSVSGYLPCGEDNNAPFLGTTDRSMFAAPPLTPAEEAAQRAQQVEVQRQDAVERRVVWDGDDGMLCDKSHMDLEMEDTVVPVGIRNEDGTVIPLSLEEQHNALGDPAEAHYSGRLESVPACIGQLVRITQHRGENVSPTQELAETQVVPSPLTSAPTSPTRTPTPTPRPGRNTRRNTTRVTSPLPPSDIPASLSLSSNEPDTTESQLVNVLTMVDASAAAADSVMLDMETQQMPEYSTAEDPIESFSRADVDAAQETPMDQDGETGKPECECGVQVDDCDTCMCDGGCRRWFHLWCMGYHCAQDTRLPAKFICFDCRVKADRNWDLIVVHDLYPRMIARFRTLAIQRRGIKVFETHGPDSLSAFTKLIACDSTVAGQVFKRLESEGFIAQEVREVDDTGFIETTSLSTKRRGRGGKANPKTKASQRRKNLQKPKYVFVQAIKNDNAYNDYFNPDPEVEKRLLELSDLRKGSRTEERSVKAKKVKISLGPPIDLGD